MSENAGGPGRVVIVGASHASAQLCGSLRQEGWAGEILLLGDEPSLPYQRPPLSKSYLAGDTELDEILIRKPDFYERQRVEVRQAEVLALNLPERSISLQGGDVVDYDHLVLCVGARPRRLDVPGCELAGVHYLRTAGDTEGIRRDLRGVRRVVIVGAGYIGLEAAASLRRLGIAVTVLEAAERVLQRVTAPDVSAFYERVHREEGVDIRTGCAVEGIEGDERVSGVRLSDGEVLPADLVIIGVGVVPQTDLAAQAGLDVADGIVIDAHGRTTDERVFAAGDCAAFPDPWSGTTLRLESVPNAVEHAKVVAATICGKDKTIAALPWFWSDQYDLKLQIAGLNTGYDDVVVRGETGAGREFTCFYLREGRLVAADCVNRPQDFVFAKRAIAQGLEGARDVLADPDVPLASVLHAAST